MNRTRWLVASSVAAVLAVPLVTNAQGGPAPKPKPKPVEIAQPASAPPAPVKPAPPPQPPPPDQVIMIRGTQKTVEIIPSHNN